MTNYAATKISTPRHFLQKHGRMPTIPIALFLRRKSEHIKTGWHSKPLEFSGLKYDYEKLIEDFRGEVVDLE